MTSRRVEADAVAPSALEPAAEQVEARGPWARFSWVMGVIWVIFMLFPIGSALDADVSEAVRYLAIAVLLLYTAAYVAGYVWIVRSRDWDVAGVRGLYGLAVMVVLLTAAALLVGPGALGAGAFLVSLAMFTGPLKRAIPLASAVLVAQYITLAIVFSVVPNGFGEHGVLLMPPVIVYVSVMVVRLVIAAQERHDVIERQMALVAERERVARDVHDVLGHSLTVVTVKAELAERLVEVDPGRAKAEIAQIRSLSREALAEVRATVAGLRVARLSDELEAARVALDGAGIRSDLPANADAVDPRRRIVVAWVLREAITNVVRHSRASRCVVSFASDRIVVVDDGVGTPAEVAEVGLRGIRERAHLAGGTLVVSDADPGTRLEVRW